MTTSDALFVLGFIAVVFAVDWFWRPCICRYLRYGERCPRHGIKPPTEQEREAIVGSKELWDSEYAEMLRRHRQALRPGDME